MSFLYTCNRQGILTFIVPQIARSCCMLLSCSFISNEVFYKNHPKSDDHGSFSAILPIFLAEIICFPLIFYFRVNLEQSIIAITILAIHSLVLKLGGYNFFSIYQYLQN